MAAVVEAVKSDPTAEVLAIATATEPSDTAPGIPAIETAPRLPAVARGSQPPQRLNLDAPVQDKSTKIPRTRPGVTGRPRAPSRPLSIDEEFPPTRVSQITIGASIAMRKQSRRGPWLVLLFLLLAGGAATAAILYATRDDKSNEPSSTPQKVEPKPVATLKFMTEPADAEIRIEGAALAAGVRTIELPAGAHQIEIYHVGFKAWLTSIDLSSGEIQTLRVVLEPLGGTPATSEATLKLSSTPAGLEVLIDGQLFALRTPFRTPIKVGPHTLTIRQNGVEVWKQSLTAAPNNNYEFSPTITDETEKPDHPTVHKSHHTDVAPTHPSNDTPAPGDSSTGPAPTTPAITTPPPTTTQTVTPPAPPPAPSQPAPTPTVTTPVAPPVHETKPPVAPAGPMLVAPTAVTRLGGQTPSISRTRNSDIPPIVAAKVCIDAGGNVMSADLITKMDKRAQAELLEAIHTWTYAPYKKNGTPWPACFVVSFRVR